LAAHGALVALKKAPTIKPVVAPPDLIGGLRDPRPGG
jgi:hypothetical protein